MVDPSLLVPINERRLRGLSVTKTEEETVIERQSRSESSEEDRDRDEWNSDEIVFDERSSESEVEVHDEGGSEQSSTEGDAGVIQLKCFKSTELILWINICS